MFFSSLFGFGLLVIFFWLVFRASRAGARWRLTQNTAQQFYYDGNPNYPISEQAIGDEAARGCLRGLLLVAGICFVIGGLVMSSCSAAHSRNQYHNDDRDELYEHLPAARETLEQSREHLEILLASDIWMHTSHISLPDIHYNNEWLSFYRWHEISWLSEYETDALLFLLTSRDMPRVFDYIQFTRDSVSALLFRSHHPRTQLYIIHSLYEPTTSYRDYIEHHGTGFHIHIQKFYFSYGAPPGIAAIIIMFTIGIGLIVVFVLIGRTRRHVVYQPPPCPPPTQ